MNKIELRRVMRERLSGFPPEERRVASVAVMNRMLSLGDFQHASVIMLYMPIQAEVDVTLAALRCFQHGKTLCVPRVDWKRQDMEPVEVRSFADDDMDVDEKGIRSPRDGRPVSPALIDLAVVPGLAFDLAGHRLGRGGGFYDRFLGHLRPDATIVGVCFDRQIVDRVPSEGHDIKMHAVVTDRRASQAGPSAAKP